MTIFGFQLRTSFSKRQIKETNKQLTFSVNLPSSNYLTVSIGVKTTVHVFIMPFSIYMFIKVKWQIYIKNVDC